MPEPWVANLGDLQVAPPAEREAWLAEHPLRAFLQDVAVGEIRRCVVNRVGPPEDGAPYFRVLRLRVGGMSVNLRLPISMDFKGLRFARPEGDDPRKCLLHFDTDRGVITTNPQEFFAAMDDLAPMATRQESQLEADFLSLGNVFTVHVPPPVMPAFTSRHLGLVDPGLYGDAEASLSLPRLSDRPLRVVVEGLGQEDAEAIDGVLDQFTGGLDRLLAEAAEAVVANMRAYAAAAYRDPDGPPLTGRDRDETFEAALALTDPARIWDHVQPCGLRLCRAGDRPAPPAVQRVAEGPIYATLEADCDWEIEHGLGLVFREGTTLTKVGAQGVWVGERV